MSRRWVHLLAGLLAASLSQFFGRTEIVVLALLVFGLLLVSKHQRILRSLHDVQRGGFGEVLFPLSVALAAWLFLPDRRSYTLALLTLAVADPLAGLIGSAYGRPILKPWLGKSWLGSLAFLVSSLVLATEFIGWPTALAAALPATIAEALTPFGFDNLTIILANWLGLLAYGR